MPCDYCKGFRDVVIKTQFREEAGERRCLATMKNTTEPCGTLCVYRGCYTARMHFTNLPALPCRMQAGSLVKTYLC